MAIDPLEIWFANPEIVFFSNGLNLCYDRCVKCIELIGNCVEQDDSTLTFEFSTSFCQYLSVTVFDLHMSSFLQ
jgi:hypothetical protein